MDWEKGGVSDDNGGGLFSLAHRQELRGAELRSPTPRTRAALPWRTRSALVDVKATEAVTNLTDDGRIVVPPIAGITHH